jgi:hypothetical protein
MIITKQVQSLKLTFVGKDGLIQYKINNTFNIEFDLYLETTDSLM